MSTLVSLYDRSPVIVQNLMLSSYGLWLRYLRYGRGQQVELERLRRSERYSKRELDLTQLDLLNATVSTAARAVPYYRDGRLPEAGLRSIEALAELPILTKTLAQAAGRSLVSDQYRDRPLQQIHTGGTTGTPLTVFCDRAALQRNYAFFFRLREWAGIGSADRVATFAGRTIVPPGSGPPYWRHNWASRTLLFSSYHLGANTVDQYLDRLAAFGPQLIDSYPSSLEPLARRLVQRGSPKIGPKAIITSSETLLPEARSTIEAAFGCPVFDHYGSAEMSALITQCEAGTYHVNPEYGIVEILVDGRPARPGECGEIVATGFVNQAMPFIRYATGDLAVQGEIGCRCGRAFPVVERIEGRNDDVLLTPEGLRVGRLDPIFKAVEAVHEARLVQDARDHVRVEVVAMATFSEAERTALLGELRRRLGPTMRMSIVLVDRLERTGRGKLRTVINAFAQEPRSTPES